MRASIIQNDDAVAVAMSAADVAHFRLSWRVGGALSVVGGRLLRAGAPCLETLTEELCVGDVTVERVLEDAEGDVHEVVQFATGHGGEAGMTLWEAGPVGGVDALPVGAGGYGGAEGWAEGRRVGEMGGGEEEEEEEGGEEGGGHWVVRGGW